MLKTKSSTFVSIAAVVIAALVWVASVPKISDAMLVPVNAATGSQTVNRAADIKTIEVTLESKIIRNKLHNLGLSDAEIQSRIAHLSDDQLHQLATQIRAVNPGGGLLIGLLIVVVLFLLIIYLLKRIL